MGILPGSKEPKTTPGAKRRSTQLDFSGLGPLKTTGTVGFSAFRDQGTEAAQRRKSRKKSNGGLEGAMDEDSEDDDDEVDPLTKMEESDDKVVKNTHLAPEDAKLQAELKAGIDRIKVRSLLLICYDVWTMLTPLKQLKRAHSAEPDSIASASYDRKSPSAGPTAGEATPTETPSSTSAPAAGGVASLLSQAFTEESTVGSPLKKQRANSDDNPLDRSAGFPSAIGDVLGRAAADKMAAGSTSSPTKMAPAGAVLGPKDESDEEL